MRFIVISVSLLAVLIVAALVGPSFVDWNKYKPQIITQVKNATGLDVQVNGDLSLSILPVPHVKIEGLVVQSPRKIRFENLLSMKSAEVSVAVLPLLQKKIQISSVTLIEPDIQIEMMADGTPSWQTDKLGGANKGVAEQVGGDAEAKPAEGQAMESVSLSALEIENGRLSFVDHKTNAQHIVEDINIDLEADSLKGPFDLDGNLTYQDKKISMEVETGKLPAGSNPLQINAELSMPDANAEVSFDGVATIQAPFDVQGQTEIDVKSIAALAGAFGTTLGETYNQSLEISGLLSANENRVTYNDMQLSFGSFDGAGKFDVQNLKNKNPIRIDGNIDSASILDLDQFKTTSKAKPVSSEERLKQSAKIKTAQKGLVPQTLTLPMPVDANVKLNIGGVKINDNVIKGVFADIKKSGADNVVTFKAMDMPGQGRAEGQINASYASTSKSPKTGQVIYADPNFTYKVNGQIGSLKEFLAKMAPDADTKAVTNLYSSAQFNLNGAINNRAVSLKDSTLKLDDMVVGLSGSYAPAFGGGRAKAAIDMSAGNVDFDRILQAQGGKKSSSNSNASAGGVKANPKAALKPLEDFSLPLDLTFDVSLQKARINQADLTGLRLNGALVGQKLTLTNASVNDFAGATASVKGVVNNIAQQSGMDLALYAKTQDLGRVANALKVDISKLPAGLKALEANITTKGDLQKMAFAVNVKALGGQVDANGNAANVLDTPAFDNLSVRLKHPNLVKAIQIVSPEFKGATGLQQPIDFFTNANSTGKTYTLSGMRATLGKSNFGGDLKIDTGSKVPSIRGNIQAGVVALDDLLGAKKKAKSASSSKNQAAPTKTSERWSKAPIDLGWMKTIDVDVSLAASSITYGAWNLTQPSTNLKIGNGQMNVEGMKAGVFGGQTNLSADVKSDPVRLDVKTDMRNIDLERLAKALSGSSKLQSAGTVSFDVAVNSTGNSAFDLINALNGQANLEGRDVTLKGFDLVKLARGLASEEKLITSATSFLDGALSNGQTRFDTLSGDYKIEKGVVKINSMAMDSAEANISSMGYADLPKWFINVDNVITLKNVSDLDPFTVKIKGAIDNPTDTFGKNILEDYLGAKIKRKLAKELPDLLGSDTSDALKKLGIFSQPEKKSETQTPAANDNSTPAQQQPAPTPKKIEKPEDAINELLKSDNPEEAINNVLKGLF